LNSFCCGNLPGISYGDTFNKWNAAV